MTTHNTAEFDLAASTVRRSAILQRVGSALRPIAFPLVLLGRGLGIV